ncbi:MAG TPA: hypothetical protein VFD19_02675 [Clostridia bacterium]|nr:hypothetical protein [Clostridia bacterium]
MKNRTKNLIIVLSILLVFAASFGVSTLVRGLGSDKAPIAYVISDGSDRYYLDYNLLNDSFLAYRYDQDLDDAQLAKFYFDTLAGDVNMDRFKAYVSEDTIKFVSYDSIQEKYLETRNVEATYRWFNGTGSTPAFSVITKVLVLDMQGNVKPGYQGRYYVDTEGYIIPRSTYVLNTTAPQEASVNVSVEFTVSVTNNDYGQETLRGSLRYKELSDRDDYTLKVKVGDDWVAITDGTFGSPVDITPDWETSVLVQFIPHAGGTYSMNFSLETTDNEVLTEQSPIIKVIAQPMEFSTNVPTAFRLDTPTEFSMTVTANDDAGKMVQAHFTIPPGADLEYYDSDTGQWLPLPTVLGPGSGFPLTDETLLLRGTFSDDGTHTIGVEYIEVGTEEVLGSTDIVIKVERAMEVNAQLPVFYTNLPAAFQLSTIANDDAGKQAQIHFIVSSDVTIEYQDTEENWQPLTDGWYGPAEGFAVTNTTYTIFRLTSASTGMKPVEVEFVEVGSDTVLTDKLFIATVVTRAQPSIIIPGMPKITINSNFSVTPKLLNPQGNMYSVKISLERVADGTVLYTSPLLAPGATVGTITLTQPVASGTYDTLVRYQAYAEDGITPLNSADVETVLIVN